MTKLQSKIKSMKVCIVKEHIFKFKHQKHLQ